MRKHFSLLTKICRLLVLKDTESDSKFAEKLSRRIIKVMRKRLLLGIVSGIVLLFVLRLAREMNLGYQWMWDTLLLKNLELIRKNPNLTIDQKYTMRFGFAYAYFKYVKDHSDGQAVILFPPKKVLDSTIQSLRNIPQFRGIENLGLAVELYFWYPRKVVRYGRHKRVDSLYGDQITHIAVIGGWGYHLLPALQASQKNLPAFNLLAVKPKAPKAGRADQANTSYPVWPIRFLGFVVLILLGALTAMILFQLDLLTSLALGFFIGSGILAVFLLILDIVGIPINIRTVGIVMLVWLSGLVGIWWHRRSSWRIRFLPEVPWYHYSGWWWVAMLVTVFVAYAISVKSLWWPTFAWDALRGYDLYGKAIAHEQTLYFSLYDDGTAGMRSAYPPLYNIMLALAYMLGYSSTKIVPTLFFAFGLLAIYLLLVRITYPPLAMLSVLGIATTPELLAQSAINITNVPQAFYSALGVTAFLVWYRHRERTWLWLSGLLLGWGTFIRQTPILITFSVFIILVWIIWSEKQYRPIRKLIPYGVFAFIAVFPLMLWRIYMMMHPRIGEYQLVRPALTIIREPAKWHLIWEGLWELFRSHTYYGYTFDLLALLLLLLPFGHRFFQKHIHTSVRKRARGAEAAVAFRFYRNAFVFVVVIIVVTTLTFGLLLYQSEIWSGMHELVKIVKQGGAKRFWFNHVMLAWIGLAVHPAIVGMWSRLFAEPPLFQPAAQKALKT